ncbi:MAG: hypothetical protein R6X18_06240 [Chloroflexota bacterium]
MKRQLLLVMAIGIGLLALVACNPGEGESNGGNTCPTPQEGTLLFTYADQGYCLLYPSTHVPVDLGGTETVFVVGDIMNHTDPRVTVNVTDAAGVSTEDAAARILADFGLPDTNPPTSATLGGREALVLDNMPGQDINRRVVAVHNGRVYDLTFLPIGPDYGEIGEQTEEFYNLVLNSFTFTD